MRRLALVVVLVLAGAQPAVAVTAPEPGPGAVGEIPLPRLALPSAPAPEVAEVPDPARTRRRLTASAALPDARVRAHARWNAWTGLPHRLPDAGVAPVTAAGGRLEDAAAAEAAARGYLFGRPALWAGEDRPAPEDLVRAKAKRVGRTWFLVFAQRHRGVEVEGGRVDLRLRDDGTVVLLGSDWFPGIDVAVTPRLPLGTADARARLDVGFVAARDRALGGSTVIVPRPGDDGRIAYRLAHRVRHRTDDPPALWVSWVDATTGETIARENELRYLTLTGTASGQIHPATPTDPLETRPFAHEIVGYSHDSTSTNATGSYALANVNAGYIMKTGLRGPYLDVLHFALAEAQQTATAPAGGVLHFAWTPANSDTSERDAFYHAHVARARVKAIEPGFTGLDYRMPCLVNIGNQCNAFWDGVGINFYRWGIRPSDGKACANTATIGDVVYHEYGHGRTQEVWSPFIPSGALHEGLSDYFAATITDQPGIGRGFFGPGTTLRTTDNTQRVDFAGCAGEVHCVGNAISGALWDLRGRLIASEGAAFGERLADSLFHFAGYGGAAWHDDYVLDLLVVDDDDGTLLNGTPHFDAICAAFTPRGFACPAVTHGVWFEHAPLPDLGLGTGAFTVNARIGSFGGAFDAGSPTLWWRVNGGLWHDVAMNPLGGGNWRSAIPPMPAGGDVEYYLAASDLATGPATSPAGAPGEAHAFHVGTLSTVWADDFQTDRGWTSSIDGATTGRWMRVDPHGTSTGGTPDFFFSPEDDHTPGAGTFCFVTHDTTSDLGAGYADVDGGCVTLTSPLIDLAGLDNARLEYWRWFVDETKYDDTLSVALSSNGGASWVEVERIFLTEPGWQGHGLDIEDWVPLTAQFRIRLRTCDGGGGSLLEAALDDVAITTRLFGAVAVGDGPEADGAATAFLARPAPNPSSPGDGTAIAFGVAAGAPEAPVRLEIVDARGRLVRTLVDQPLPPGRHVRRWNGEDDAGRRAGAGVYFVRLAMDSETWREKLVRLD
jgi:Zn-dependent metalloprotease